MSSSGTRHSILKYLHGETLPGHAVHVEAGQGVGALPLLLVGGHLHVVHHEGNPPAEHEHPAADHRGAVQGPGQGRGPVELRFAPGHRVYVEDPEVGQSAAAHPSVDDEARVGSVSVKASCG